MLDCMFLGPCHSNTNWKTEENYIGDKMQFFCFLCMSYGACGILLRSISFPFSFLLLIYGKFMSNSMQWMDIKPQPLLPPLLLFDFEYISSPVKSNSIRIQIYCAVCIQPLHIYIFQMKPLYGALIRLEIRLHCCSSYWLLDCELNQSPCHTDTSMFYANQTTYEN